MDRSMLALLLVVSAGCGAPDGKEATSGSFEGTIQPILDANCGGYCHVAGWDLVLRSPGARQEMLADTTTCWDPLTNEVYEKPVVVPGDPAGSSLWHKTANVDLNCGREMPPLGTGGLVAIDPEAFEAVERWIRDGAIEDWPTEDP